MRWYCRCPLSYRDARDLLAKRGIDVDRKWRNNIIESGHASLQRLTDPGKGVQSHRTAKAILKSVEAIPTIKKGHVYGSQNGIMGEMSFVKGLFGLA